MKNISFKTGALALVLSLFVTLAIPSSAKAEAMDVNFKTYDGVILSGKFYPSAKPKEGATVILLHEFAIRKGGDSSQDGWEKLALDLQAKGQTVLSFDFRGHGKSVNIDPKFWLNLHNRTLPGAASAKQTKINFSEFPAAYYPHLVNDITAAKAFLDIRNDDGEANTSNLVVIGAGEGATLGALWMASEWRRVQCESVDITPGSGVLNLRPAQAKKFILKPMTAVDPEGTAQLAAVWISISPTLGGKNVATQLSGWLRDINMPRPRRVQTVFFTGTKDKALDDFSLAQLKKIKLGFIRDKKEGDPKTKSTGKEDQKWTGEFKYDSNKVGSKLLAEANDDLVNNYMAGITKKGEISLRTFSKKKSDDEKSAFSWINGLLDKTGNPVPQLNLSNLIYAKTPGDVLGIQPLPIRMMGFTN